MANLKVENLYLKRGQASIYVKNGKGGKDRVVDIGSNLKKQILEFLDYRTMNSPYLFPSERGEKMTRSGIQQVFKKWASVSLQPALGSKLSALLCFKIERLQCIEY